MEIFPGVHQIASRFEGRNLFQYLFVGERIVLLDTGIDRTPETVIFPYLKGLGLAPQQLDIAITLHPDLDHQGGNAALRAAHPGIVLAAHEFDRALIESPQRLFDERYNHLRRDHGVGLDLASLPLAGAPVAVDLGLRGGETLRIGAGANLHIWHLPGHARGHLGVYDPGHRALFSSDAIHGAGCPAANGGLAFGPTYYCVASYLATIEFLEGVTLDHIYSGHWPNCHGAETRRFLAESRSFVERADVLLRSELLRGDREGCTLAALIDRLGPRLGDWPASRHQLLMFALHGHLERLCERGEIEALAGPPVRWRRPDPGLPSAARDNSAH